MRVRSCVRDIRRIYRLLYLLGATAGWIGRTVGGKKTIEYEVDWAKPRNAALNQRDADHGRKQEPMDADIVPQDDSDRHQ